MTSVGGWAVAALALALALVLWRELGARMEAVARACHELRGPLTAAGLGLHLGARSGRLSRDRVKAIEAELERAALALEDLAGAGRGRGGPRRTGGLAVRPADVDVSEVVRDSVEAWQPVAEARGVRLSCAPSRGRAIVRGDKVRLAQATGNLVANAVEHGGGSVVVRCRVEADAVRVEVTDEGQGLPQSVAELVRGAGRRRRGFVRDPARRRGRGRGLAIALAIAEAHQGRLAAAPSERGARLVLELPRAGGRDAGAGRGGARPPA